MQEANWCDLPHSHLTPPISLHSPDTKYEIYNAEWEIHNDKHKKTKRETQKYEKKKHNMRKNWYDLQQSHLTSPISLHSPDAKYKIHNTE